MSDTLILAELKMLRERIDQIEQEVRDRISIGPQRIFGDLFGALPELAALTDEDLGDLRYRVPNKLEDSL